MEEASNKSEDFISLIVLGMAGSGKTSFVKRLTTHLYKIKQLPYLINLDPACKEVPFPANIDIKDTVNYKDIMKKYRLGPNGAIVTSLNLFSIKFDQVLGYIQQASSKHKYAILDTPGQIEVFTWSVSGSIITESLASTVPSAVVYVMDVVRSTNPVTFMSNMLYACSVLYKTRLPFILVLNKCDIIIPDQILEWITDFESFQDAISAESSYAANLTSVMSLALEEFYRELRVVGVSSLNGEGFDKFLEKVEEARQEYHTDYKVEWQRIRAERELQQEQNNKERLKNVAESSSSGEHIPMVSTQIPREKEINEMYLKYPGDDSSSDDEQENRNVEEKKEEQNFDDLSFKSFIDQHVKKQEARKNKE